MVIISLCLFTIWGFAQVPATTEDGKKVILNEDGTWLYDDGENTPAASYECENLIKIVTDKMTGKSTYGAESRIKVYNKDATNGFVIYVYEKSRSIVLNMYVVGASECIRKDSKILILFRNGKRLELVNNGDANCNSFFDLYFDGAYGKTRELKMFSKNEVESFRIWTAQGYVEEDFSNEESKHLMHLVDCLMKIKE